MSGWRTSLRIAWREARRAKARSALIVSMIALPVMALSFAAVTYDTFQLRGVDCQRHSAQSPHGGLAVTVDAVDVSQLEDGHRAGSS